MKLVILIGTLIANILASANETGNCYTGRYLYSSERVLNYKGKLINTIDPSINNGSVNLDLTKPRRIGAPGIGVKVTTTRYALYGRFTARFSSINVPGVVTAFITMSDVGDEIDYEIVGPKPIPVTTNVFYHTVGKTVPEYERGVHGKKHYLKKDVGEIHTYTIDWKHDSITWMIDGEVIRIVNKADSISKLNPNGPKWFPTTPSLIQFAVWDAGRVGLSDYTWQGGPTEWGTKTRLTSFWEYVDIECYDDDDQIVQKWPANKSNPNPTVIYPIPPNRFPAKTGVYNSPSSVVNSNLPFDKTPSEVASNAFQSNWSLIIYVLLSVVTISL
ncbi:hypothetical protein HDV02_001419 [Globomyces sp. JEL0801]|nr:hypothetical protein HDV02_001419 [Globomyces sp. JEL0801]